MSKYSSSNIRHKKRNFNFLSRHNCILKKYKFFNLLLCVVATHDNQWFLIQISLIDKIRYLFFFRWLEQSRTYMCKEWKVSCQLFFTSFHHFLFRFAYYTKTSSIVLCKGDKGNPQNFRAYNLIFFATYSCRAFSISWRVR